MATWLTVFLFTEDRWASLKEISEERGRSLDEMVSDLKGFSDSHDRLAEWLTQKEKMVSFLGPIAIEPIMLENQVKQVEVSTGIGVFKIFVLYPEWLLKCIIFI